MHASRVNPSHPGDLLLHQSLVYTKQQHIFTPCMLLWTWDVTKLSCGTWEYIYKKKNDAYIKRLFSPKVHELSCLIWRSLMGLHSTAYIMFSQVRRINVRNTSAAKTYKAGTHWGASEGKGA